MMDESKATKGKPCRVVLDTAAQGGKLGQRGLAAEEKLLQALSETGLLVRRDGNGAEERVDDHAGVGDPLRR